MAVRFGRTTPAERAYADLFGTYYFEILERVSELRDLAEAGRIVGTMLWLREAGLPFDATSLASDPQPVFTPHQVSLRSGAPLDDIEARRPLIVYNENGPTDIFPASGGAIRLHYRDDRLERIDREHGSSLRVERDALGSPLAIGVEGVGASAFVPGEDGYLRFVDGVVLSKVQGALQFKRTPTARSLPISNPQEIVESVASGFLRRATK
jgi:hypothetical protein